MLYKILVFTLLIITSVSSLSTYLTIKDQPSKSEYKYIDLPEEFNQIQSGDTLNIYTVGDTTYIRFIPPNTICNNKAIIKI